MEELFSYSFDIWHYESKILFSLATGKILRAGISVILWLGSNPYVPFFPVLWVFSTLVRMTDSALYAETMTQCLRCMAEEHCTTGHLFLLKKTIQTFSFSLQVNFSSSKVVMRCVCSQPLCHVRVRSA